MARGKQISFPPLQTHKKNFEYAMILICDPLHRDRRANRQGDGLGHQDASVGRIPDRADQMSAH